MRPDRFFQALNFSSANEDGRSELDGLAVGPTSRLLCLAGSGARALDLAAGSPREILAIDLNPMQLRLTALKIAAHQTLADVETLWAYLGVTPCRDRLQLHAAVARALSPADRAFWADRAGLIRAGVWYAGRWERVLRALAGLAGLLRGRAVKALFAAQDVPDQARLFADRWDRGVWRPTLRLMAQRWFWVHVVGEPGGAHLPDPRATSALLAARFARAAGAVLFRDCDFASLMLRGRHYPPDSLPLHLQPDRFAAVREGAAKITLAQMGLDALDGAGRFDGYSLSDFGSYCDQGAYDAAWAGVVRTAAPDARFVERVLLNPLTPGQAVAARLAVDAEASARASRLDRAIIYDLRIGRIVPA